MATVFSVVCSLGLTSAQALTPPAPEPAEIVYSNGGRILSMKADGSERQVLASRLPRIENTDLGFVDPAVSPDRQKLVFVNRRSGSNFGGYIADVVVAEPDGTDQVTVLKGDPRNIYSSPSWSADGKRLIVAYYWKRGRKQTGGVLSVRSDGSDRKIILKLKTRVIKNSWSGASAVGNPVMSPDGTKLLFVRLEDFQYDDDGRLEILDLATRTIKLVGKFSHGGTWSPDGTRIVHSERNTGHDEVCGGNRCQTAGKLKIVNADGTGSRLLIKGGGHEMQPEWSEDGSRIAFAGNRNMPGSSLAYEIYTVEPGGSCLTWLTNGTPASIAPDWSGPGYSTTDPGECGGEGRPVLQEVKFPDKVGGRAIRNWMGSDFEGMLYAGSSGPYPDESFVLLEYGDCSWYEPLQCGQSFETLELPICMARNDLTSLIGPGTGKTRGVPSFTSSGDGLALAGVVSGESYFLIFREARDRTFTHRDFLMGIRPFGSTENPSKLPPPVYPAPAIRKMNQVIRVQKRTRSVVRTAKIVGLGRRAVRQNLKLKPALLRYGPIRTVECSKANAN